MCDSDRWLRPILPSRHRVPAVRKKGLARAASAGQCGVEGGDCGHSCLDAAVLYAGGVGGEEGEGGGVSCVVGGKVEKGEGIFGEERGEVEGSVRDLGRRREWKESLASIPRVGATSSTGYKGDRWMRLPWCGKRFLKRRGEEGGPDQPLESNVSHRCA